MDQVHNKQDIALNAAEPGGVLLGSVLVLGHAVKHVFNAAFFIILPEIQLHRGLSNSAIGTLATIRNTGGGVANLPAGYLADRYVDRWPMILAMSMVTVGAFYFMMGTANAYWLLALTATLSAVGISAWHPPAISALAQKFASRRGLAIALHGTGGSIGEALGPILAGSLLGVLLWSSVLRLSLAPALVMALLAWLGLRGLRGHSSNLTSFRTYAASVYHLVRYPALVKVLVITGGFSSVQAIVITFLPVYLRVELGYSPLVMAAFISASHVVGIVSQPAMGFLSDRYSRRAVLLPALVALGTAVLMIPTVGSGLPLVIVVGFMGAFLFSLTAILLAAAMDVAGTDIPGTTVSLVFSAATIFSAVMPTVAGVLADAFGLQWVFIFAAGMAFGTAGFTAFRSVSQ